VTPGRELRIADMALPVAVVLAVAGLSFALFLGYRLPEHARPGWTTEQRAATSADPLPGDLSVMTAATTVAESAAPATEPPVPAPPASTAPAAPTDVVLLPCTEPNPRPDGRFLIPPHDPTRRTIVGLPAGPGEPRRGLVIPPHDPGTENRIRFELVPLDSILDHTIRIPPHDPTRYRLIRPDTLPCLAP
jgi:hypothetical protein